MATKTGDMKPCPSFRFPALPTKIGDTKPCPSFRNEMRDRVSCPPLMVVGEALELAAAAGVLELAQGLGLDLADALARHLELLADLLERVLVAVAQAEAHLEDPALALRERLEGLLDLLLEVDVDDRVGRRGDELVLDEVAEVAVLLLADRRLERDGLLGDLDDLADLADRHVHLLGDLLARRLAADLLDGGPRDADELVDRLDHVDRDADRPGLVGDGPGDGLPDPPGRVGRELVAAAVLELLDGLHEAHVPFLDEVQELEAPVAVLLGDGDDQPQVGRDELLLGLVADLLAGRDGPDGPPQGLGVEPDLGRLPAQLLVGVADLLLEGRVVLLLLGQGRGPVVAGVLEVVDDLEPGPQLVDDLLPVGRAEVEVADGPADLDDEPAPADQGLALLRDAVELPAELLDPLDLAQDLLLFLLELALGDVLLGDVEPLLDDERVFLDPVLEGQDLVEDEASPAEGLDDALLAPLDLAGDGDLPLARQQRDVAHLAEVELDRVGRPLQAVGRDEVGLAPLGDHLLL